MKSFKCDHSNRKATEQYVPVALHVYNADKVVLSCDSVDEILKCDHSNEILSSTFLWCCLLCFTRWF